MAHLSGQIVFPLGGDPEPAVSGSGQLLEVNVWARDLLELVFSPLMKVDTAMQNPLSYTITKVDDAGQDITVTAVKPGNALTATRIFLVTTFATPGTLYEVSVPGDLLTSLGVGMDHESVARFRAHRTKVDGQLMRSTMYDTRPNAVFRQLLNAIGYEDHLIGGDILVE